MNGYHETALDYLQELREETEFTWTEVTKMWNKKFASHDGPRTLNALRKTYKRLIEEEMDEIIAEPKEMPKILLYDIETAPMLGYAWSLWDNNIALNQLHTDWYVLSWSAKWLGDSDDNVMYQDQRNCKNIEDDSKLLKRIWELLDEADIVITQNGKKFDQKKLNARFILNGYEPPSTYRHIDTLVLAKRHFGFSSNKLEYMTSKLCTKFKKSKHAKFSGFDLWKQCMANNIDAWNEMEEYNKLDVLSLEELYTKLIPWDNSINFNIYHDSHDHVCKCGSTDFQKSGFHYTNAGKHQRYRCTDCGAESRDKVNLLDVSKRKSLRR